jgi:WD40 repeat protein
MSDVFISYSRRDIAFARLIREALQQSQIDTWIDWDRIPVGERWWQEITEAIEGANVFMLIISRNSLGSKVCRDEIELALQNHKRIVPILVDQLTPEEIAGLAPDLPQFNWVVFERDHIFRLEVDPAASSEKAEDREVALAKLPQFEEALRKLSVAIHTDWEWVKYHTRLQVEALRWENNGRDASYLVRGAALQDAEQQLLRAAGRDPQPTSLQIDFATASRKEEERRQLEKLTLERKSRRRQRYVLVAVVIGLVVSSSLGVVAWGQRNQALSEANARATAQAQTEEQRQIAVQQRQVAVDQRNVAVSRQLASQAAAQITNQDVGLGLLLATEAYHHSPTMDAQSSLLRLILTEPRLRYDLLGHTDVVNDVAISPDGKTVASASADGTIGIWDVATGKESHAALKSSEGGFDSVAFSPDGKYLVSGEGGTTGVAGGQVVLWDVAQDYKLEVLFEGSSWVNQLVFSPDGKSLAAAFSDQSVMVWSVADRKVVCQDINGRAEEMTFTYLAFSPDGKTLAVATTGKPASDALRVWDASTCKQVGAAIDAGKLAKLSALDGADVGALAFSPDGKQLTVAVSDRILVIDPGTRAALRDAVVIHTNYRVASIAYTPDSKTMALGVGDKTIVLVDSATGKAVGQPMIGQRGAVSSVAFGSDGHTLVSGGWGADVAIWDIQNSPLAQSLADAGKSVVDVAFSPDGKVLASTNLDDTIHLTSTTTWQPIGQPLLGTGQGIRAVTFSPDGKLLASGGTDKLVHLWDATTGKPLGEPLTAPDVVDCLAFSPDGKWLAAAGADDRLVVWDAASRKQVLADYYPPPMSGAAYDIDTSKMIETVGFSPDSSTLYFSKGSGMTYLMPVAEFTPGSDAVTRQIKWAQGFSLNEIRSLMSPDGKTIALLNSMDIRLYDVASLQIVGLPMYGHTDQVTSLAFTPDGKLLVSGGQDATVRLWNPATGQSVGLPLTGPTVWIPSLDISSDGKWLAAASPDGIHVWDLSVEDWESLACGIAHRNMFSVEWQQFLPDEPYRMTCPDMPADASGAKQIADLARSQVDAGQTEEAKTTIGDAVTWIVASGDQSLNNNLCWGGSLDGFAAQVMPACEKAVSLDPSPGFRDSRGLARALAGDTKGAVEDFQAFVDWSKENGQYDSMGKQREGWIAALKQGKNPFDQKTLDSLRS